MSLATNVQNLATRVATEAKAIRTLVNGNAADLTALTTTNKTNLVAAINELQNEVNSASGGGATIDDVTASTTTVYSSSKTVSVADASAATAVSNLVAAAPALLDTLDEIAAALGDDPNFATTMTNALAARVRFDAAQVLTAAQMLQARTNIDAASATDVGDTATNFVTTFEAGLV